MNVPQDLKYTSEHEWAKVESEGVRVGISDYAQAELGDVVFVELPEVGAECKQGERFATIESVKAVSDIYAPVDGKVVEVNNVLSDKPELVNESAYEQGWMAIIEPANKEQLSSLKDATAYRAFIEEISK